MNHLRILAGLLSLFLLTSSLAFAQGSDSIRVIGSGIGNYLVETVAEAGALGALELETIGTTAGIDRFCSGDVDIATAIRAMTAAEGAICGSNDVAYDEFVVGHYVVAILGHADATLECLTSNQLSAALKPSASNVVADWTFYDLELADQPLTLFLPQQDRIDYLVLDSLIAGDGLRVDATTYADPAEALTRVAETPGSLGFVPWSAQLEGDESIVLLQFGADAGAQCVNPSAENVENSSYEAALSLYLIVNRARPGDNASLADFLRFITDEANSSVIAEAGFIPPSESAYAVNQSLLSADESAYGDAPQFVVPAALSGSLRIVGSASAFDVLKGAADTLTRDNASLEIALDFVGRANGLASLCAGDAHIAALDADALATDLEACANNSVATTPVKLGSQAAILLGNEADDYAACLTVEQIATAWRAESTASVDDWSHVDPAFPAEKLRLFAPSVPDQHSDILLQAAGQVIPPTRPDTEKHYDPLYRAAAVGNVPGALTYMNWHEYQRVLSNEQANIHLVSVDAGAGCVAPSPASIEDGSYALSRPATLLIRKESLANVNAQSYLWTLFGDDSFSRLEREGYVGLSALELPALRRQLQASFAEAADLYAPANPDDSSAAAGDASADDASAANSE